METYKHKETIKARLFVEGDEDGFVTRYYNDEDVEEDGCVSTSGVMGEHSIKVPYIYLVGDQRQLSAGFGREYIIFGEEGEKSLMLIFKFENKYELI